MKRIFKGNANKGGVYQIRNLQNGKVYIGSAKCFKQRAVQHQTQLINQIHKNKKLQNSWNKWGEDAFLFEVLEVVEGTTKKRRKIEQKYLNQIQDWATIYNIKKKTVEKLGPWSSTPEETKKKMSEAHKGKKHTKETKKKISLSKKGKKNPNFGKSLPTEIKIKLSKALKGRKQTDEHVEKRISKLRGHVNKQAIINGKKVSKPVYQFDKNGILIAKFSSLTEASLKCNVNISGIVRCCKQTQKTAGGFKWTNNLQ